MTCVFCARIAAGELVAENGSAVAFADTFPLSRGHCLIVPRRHESNFFALTPAEQAATWALLAPTRQYVERDGRPDGYNIGVNVGEAAGQTVAHAHVHLIPRYRGDVADPRGGVRWVLPARAPYWQEPP